MLLYTTRGHHRHLNLDHLLLNAQKTFHRHNSLVRHLQQARLNSMGQCVHVSVELYVKVQVI